jgi:flagellar biosynthesis protein FlhB
MADEDDKSQRTEEPTQRRIEDAVKQGNIAYSREFTHFIMLVLLTVFIIFVSPSLLKQTVLELNPYVSDANYFGKEYDGDDAMRLGIKIISEMLLLAFIPLIIALIAAFLGSFLQNGIIFSPEAMTPKLSKISPLSGLKRMFSMKSLVEFVKGIVKLVVIGMTAYLSVYNDLASIHFMHDLEISTIMSLLLSLTTKMLIAICVLHGIIAFTDLMFERWRYHNSLKMTKQEVKEELKHSEGNPEIKAKIRVLRAQRAKQRISIAVPKADVIITNPTHFSVALEYDPDVMPAPKLIAKGQDKLAFKIREIAKEHDIPIIESPPLARSLYDNVEWDQFIQLEHYQAVAQIMGSIKRYANRRKKNK